MSWDGYGNEYTELKRTLSFTLLLTPRERAIKKVAWTWKRWKYFCEGHMALLHSSQFISRQVQVLCANMTCLSLCSFSVLWHKETRWSAHFKSYFQTVVFSFQRLSAEAGNSLLYVSAWTRTLAWPASSRVNTDAWNVSLKLYCAHINNLLAMVVK